MTPAGVRNDLAKKSAAYVISISRNYTVSPTELDYDAAHDYCAANGLQLLKWISMEKYYDVGFVARTTKIYIMPYAIVSYYCSFCRRCRPAHVDCSVQSWYVELRAYDLIMYVLTQFCTDNATCRSSECSGQLVRIS